MDANFQFALVKEDSRFQFGTDKDKDQMEWVKALYRATGQTQQPSIKALIDNGRDKQGIVPLPTAVAATTSITYTMHHTHAHTHTHTHKSIFPFVSQSLLIRTVWLILLV